MWIVCGAAAVICALLNLMFTARRKPIVWFGFASLSLGALTVCSFYSMDARWVANKEWSSLADTAPTISVACWIFVVALIAVNSIPLWIGTRRSASVALSE
ncbi:MAG: hypothetical protein PT944_05095 [Actinomycetaceae bacterium]|nr:hypothetical protein [Arcanobacterium sp.]MDD7687276.1 hypothetical protein [Actinomycetaceae bacterium]MDY5273554.1 hypothetical protein [Arcanobacterium sp.]